MATQTRNEYEQRLEKSEGRERPEFTAISQQFPQWNVTELEILWNRNDQIKTTADFKFFLYYCKANHVDPVLGEVVASYKWDPIKRREVLTPIVTIGVMRKRRAEVCDGLDEFQFAHDGQALIAASGTIYRKGCTHPFSSTVYYDEYVPTDRHGNISSMWQGRSHMMLSKCLEAQLTRLAFFDLCGDVLIDEETQKRDRPEEPGAAPAKPPVDEFTVGEKPEPAGKLTTPFTSDKNPAPAETKPPKAETKPPKAEAKAPAPETKPAATVPVTTPPPSLPDPTDKQIAEAYAVFGAPDQPIPQHDPVPPPPPPPPPAAMEPPTFDEMVAHVAGLIGGEKKEAHRLIARFFASYLGVKTVPKDREKLMEPLKKLVTVAAASIDTLRANPEALGNSVAGRAVSPLEEEFVLLKWPASVQALARQVMQATGHNETQFLTWIHTDIVGTGSNAISITSLEPAALEVLLPLYLLVKGRAFEVLDWALANNQPITKTLQEMESCTNKSISEWDSTFAGRILDAINDTANAVPPKPPSDDLDQWATAGLPFEE